MWQDERTDYFTLLCLLKFINKKSPKHLKFIIEIHCFTSPYLVTWFAWQKNNVLQAQKASKPEDSPNAPAQERAFCAQYRQKWLVVDHECHVRELNNEVLEHFYTLVHLKCGNQPVKVLARVQSIPCQHVHGCRHCLPMESARIPPNVSWQSSSQGCGNESLELRYMYRHFTEIVLADTQIHVWGWN